MLNRQLMFGLYLDALRTEDVLNRCRSALASRQRLLIGVVNAAKIVNVHRDPLLRNSLVDCDMILADGQSVVWASRLLKRPLPERITGIDVFESLLEMAHREDRLVYLLGARGEVLNKVVARLSQRFPGLRIAGVRDGYFKENESAAVADEIRASGADMLFLGITSPKKEIFLGTYGNVLGVPILHGVGGSFDIIAGQTRRAPVAWQKMGMEWAYRLLQEPRRLLWRYAYTNTIFLLLTAREFFKPGQAFNRAAAELATLSEPGDLRR